MTTQLITNWTDHDEALLKLLRELSQPLDIFDENLSRLNLERPEMVESIRRSLVSNEQNRLRIILRNPEPFRRHSPRLMQLFRNHPEKITILECPQHLLSLSDNLLIIGDGNALIRFHKDHARSKAIFDNTSECISYKHRFDEILREGCEPVCATILGL
jgi:hypothetical protein